MDERVVQEGSDRAQGRSTLIVVADIALYVVFVGASASVMRAGVMGILLVLGPAFGRCSTARGSHTHSICGSHL